MKTIQEQIKDQEKRVKASQMRPDRFNPYHEMKKLNELKAKI